MVRLFQRGIHMDDVKCALNNGEIIERYPDDYPYPGCLVVGHTIAHKPLHTVCGIGENELWLITAYHPDAQEWDSGYKLRRGE